MLGRRMKDKRQRRVFDFGVRVAAFNAASRAIENNFWHVVPLVLPLHTGASFKRREARKPFPGTDFALSIWHSPGNVYKFIVTC